MKASAKSCAICWSLPAALSCRIYPMAAGSRASAALMLPPPPVQPPRQWTRSADRIDLVNGRHVLQFSQLGLDASHTVAATMSGNALPHNRVAGATAPRTTPRITSDPGTLAPGASLRLDLTVMQSDGAKVVPLAYRFFALSGWGWAESALQAGTVTRP